jgi:hypothetical protein
MIAQCCKVHLYLGFDRSVFFPSGKNVWGKHTYHSHLSDGLHVPAVEMNAIPDDGLCLVCTMWTSAYPCAPLHLLSKGSLEQSLAPTRFDTWLNPYHTVPIHRVPTMAANLNSRKLLLIVFCIIFVSTDMITVYWPTRWLEMQWPFTRTLAQHLTKTFLLQLLARARKVVNVSFPLGTMSSL